MKVIKSPPLTVVKAKSYNSCILSGGKVYIGFRGIEGEESSSSEVPKNFKLTKAGGKNDYFNRCREKKIFLTW